MKHGSLYDLLHNDTMQFDGGIVMDILTGVHNSFVLFHLNPPTAISWWLKTSEDKTVRI